MNITINIPEKIYQDLKSHLLPSSHIFEEVAFVFAEVKEKKSGIILEHIKWEPLSTEDFEIRTGYHFEVKSTTISKLIKQTYDMRTSLIEFHSHINPEFVKFSYTDLSGFAEFVPHILWRVKLPYCAVVMTQKGIDALGWVEDYKDPIRIQQIVTGKKKIRPSNNSFNHFMNGEYY